MRNLHTKQFICIIYLVLKVLVLPTNVAFGTLYTNTDESVIVQTSYGKIKGYSMLSRFNRTFYGFRGIPFAKPPVEELRFRAPVPPEPWNDTLDALKDGPMCIQKNYLIDEQPPVEGKEDCLYLNVYTPKVPSIKEHPELQQRKPFFPVMVFIHYGGFFAGTGNSDYLGAHYFMDRNVVLVTFNYRLGVFGFLSTNDDASPGNWALKDQVAALKWVQENINAFGGNNKKVTIFGQSAGAGSVHYHMVSPVTKNLFHGAISQSGSTLSLWARPKNLLQAQIAKQQATFVGCNQQDDSYEMIECLRKVDAVALTESSKMFKYFSTEPFALYGPVTEKETELNPHPYITEDPLDIIKNGKFQNVPWITGVVSDEGILRAAPLLRQPNIQSQLNANFDDFGPQLFALPLSVPENDVPGVWKKITNYFLGTNYVNVSKPESVQGFIDLYSDRAFSYGSYQSVLLHLLKGHSPIWFYNFAYRGNYSYGQHFAATTEDIQFKWGVSHCDDLLYLFPSTRFFPPLKSNQDITMSKIMIQFWTNFAIYGNPTPQSFNNPVVWNPATYIKGASTIKNSDLCYLNITGPYQNEHVKLEMNNKFYPERMQFWKQLPLYENIEGIE